MLKRKYIKGETFPFGMANSKESILIKRQDYYFVSDFWTTTRYPKTKEGLLAARHHIAYNRKIDKQMKRGH